MKNNYNCLPKYYNDLRTPDQILYTELKLKCSSAENRYQYNHSLDTFQNILNEIKTYCIKNDNEDWKRCLVCGICWLEDDNIAINTAQLSLLFAKCKAAINGSFRTLGYETVSSKKNISSELHKFIPILITDYQENRQWSIRKRSRSENNTPFMESNHNINLPLTPEVDLNRVDPFHDDFSLFFDEFPQRNTHSDTDYL